MKRKLFFVVGILALIVVVAALTSPAASATKIPATKMAANGQFMSLVPPRVPFDEFGKEELVPVDLSGEPSNLTPSNDKWAQKHHLGPNPGQAKKLAQVEARAIEKNKNPAAEKKGVEYAKLLTLLIEFDRNVTDTFTDWERIQDITNEDVCVTETVDKSGPEHNELEDPATIGTLRDNNSFWVPDFSVDHYNDIMFSEDGITDRVRPDLIGPDGLPGFDISGYTMRSYFLENSEGTYDLSGTVVDWLKLPHSQAWYGADSCAGGRASMVGHPDNPIGVQQSVIDAVDVLNDREPDFPWVDFDTDGDGIVDHLVINHAGSGEEGGGGADGTYAIWSHSSDVMPAQGGYLACEAGTTGCAADHDIRVQNYIMQPEDAGVGVFVHEYGHDLGLPDLYDTSSGGANSIQFWALMSTGSHSGPIFQSMPAHMTLWSKWVLGWSDPVITNADRPRSIKVGQTSGPPFGSADGIKVNLPDQVKSLSTPYSGENMWWSNNDANWADSRLVQDFDLSGATGDVEFTFWTDYVIEELWDYAFVEASTDGGSSWVQLMDKDGITTNDDPFGRLIDYGNLQNGITGDSHGWIQMRFDLSAYAGSSISLRFRYATDAGYLDPGMFVDDIEITDDSGSLFFDDAETEGNWTSDSQAFVGSPGQGWILTTGTFNYPHYYMVEWRNTYGFDEGLLYTYDSTFLRYDTGEWLVERVPYNAPGMLVWYRNTGYTNNGINNFTFDAPSLGAKGMLLIVDSHFEPLRREPGTDGCALCNLPGRPQASNAAFNTWGTYGFQEGLELDDGSIVITTIDPEPAEPVFTDNLGWVPGIEVRLDLGGFYFRDQDASVVVPSVGGADYDWRVVWPDGSPATAFWGGGWGSGDPYDGFTLGEYDPSAPNDSVGFGTMVSIKDTADDNSFAVIHVRNNNHQGGRGR